MAAETPLNIPDMNAWRWRAAHAILDVMGNQRSRNPGSLDDAVYTVLHFFDNLDATRVMAANFDDLAGDDPEKHFDMPLLAYIGGGVELVREDAHEVSSISIKNPGKLLDTVVQAPLKISGRSAPVNSPFFREAFSLIMGATQTGSIYSHQSGVLQTSRAQWKALHGAAYKPASQEPTQPLPTPHSFRQLIEYVAEHGMEADATRTAGRGYSRHMRSLPLDEMIERAVELKMTIAVADALELPY